MTRPWQLSIMIFGLGICTQAGAANPAPSVSTVPAQDAWATYQTLKKSKAPSDQIATLLNDLMNHLAQPTQRDAAQKIILNEFSDGSQMRFWYLGKFQHLTGDLSAAKKTFDEFQQRFRDRPERLPWLDLGNFYYDIKEYPTALHCYERELGDQKRSAQTGSTVDPEFLAFLQNRVHELQRLVNQTR